MSQSVGFLQKYFGGEGQYSGSSEILNKALLEYFESLDQRESFELQASMLPYIRRAIESTENAIDEGELPVLIEANKRYVIRADVYKKMEAFVADNKKKKLLELHVDGGQMPAIGHALEEESLYDDELLYLASSTEDMLTLADLPDSDCLQDHSSPGYEDFDEETILMEISAAIDGATLSPSEEMAPATHGGAEATEEFMDDNDKADRVTAESVVGDEYEESCDDGVLIDEGAEAAPKTNRNPLPYSCSIDEDDEDEDDDQDSFTVISKIKNCTKE
jgi:hypothetical protein